MDFRYYQDLVEISSETSSIHSFFQFAEKAPFLSNCKENKCEIGTFVGCLNGVLLNLL